MTTFLRMLLLLTEICWNLNNVCTLHYIYNHIQLFGNKYIFIVLLPSGPPLTVQFIKSLFKTKVETSTDEKHHRTKQKDILQASLEPAV
jgi:hypothetical protein